jgi:hypothetical protein
MPATGPASALALGKAGAQVLLHYGRAASEADTVINQIKSDGGHTPLQPTLRQQRGRRNSRSTCVASLRIGSMYWSLMQEFEARPHREQAAGAYGGNPARLRVLKRRFYPDGVFASAIPLPEG